MNNNILHNTLLAITNNYFDSNNPLTFTAQTANSTIKLTKTGSPVVNGLQYRTNKTSNWETYTIDTVITLTNVGDYVQFKNTKNQLSTSVSNYVKFSMTGAIAASGDIQSMLNYSTFCTDYCYYKMFSSCTSLTTAPELSTTNLAQNCYNNMFNRCTSLTTAPELPATTLANQCYYQMFYDCTNLTPAPKLPATTLANQCYYYMFTNCTSLTRAPELPATNLANQCYYYMFYGCKNLSYIKVRFTNWNADGHSTIGWLSNASPSGTFECPSAFDTSIRGTSYIPDGWNIKTY